MLRKLVTICLTFTLLQLQLNSSGLPIFKIGVEKSFAQNCGSTNDQIDAGSGTSRERAQQDSMGNCVDMSTEDGDGLGTWSQVGMYWGILIGLSGILAAISWPKICIGKVSPIIFFIGSVIALLVEIIALIAYYTGKGQASDMIAEGTVGASQETEDMQIAAIDAAIAETESAHGWATFREVGVYIAAVIMILAAITAFFMGALGKNPQSLGIDVCPPGTGCDSTYIPSQHNYQKYSYRNINKDSFSKLEWEKRTQTDYFKPADSRLSYILNYTTYSTTFNQFKNYQIYEFPQLKSLILNQNKLTVIDKVEESFDIVIFEAKKIFKHALQFTFPSAQAADVGSQLGSMLGVALGVFLIMYSISTILKCIKGAMLDGISRGVYMSVWAGLEFGVAAASTSNREELGRIIDNYKALKQSIEEGKPIDAGNIDEHSAENYDLPDNVVQSAEAPDDTVAEKMTQELTGFCTSGPITEDDFEFSKSACKNKTPRTTPALDLTPITGVSGTEGIVNDALAAQEELESIENGEGGSSAFKSEMGNASAFKKRDNLRKNLLKSFRKQVDGFPSEKEMSDLRNRIQDKIQSAYDSAISSASADQIAELNNELDSLSGKNKNEKAKNANTYWQDRLAKMKNKISLGSNPFDNSNMALGLGGVNYDESSKDKIKDIEYSKLKKYKLKQNDINKDPGVPIWQLISQRYKRSGYPRLFVKLSMYSKKNKNKNKNKNKKDKALKEKKEKTKQKASK